MKKIFLAMAVAIVTATAVSAQKDDSDSKITVSIHQTDQELSLIHISEPTRPY